MNKEKNKAKNKLTIDVNAIQLNQQKFTTSEIGRGTGVHKTKKDKAKSRKQKHKKKIEPVEGE